MDKHFHIATFVTKLLDEQFSLGKFRFGLDPILGVIPGFGDAISLILSLYIVWIGKKLTIPKHEIAKMTQNILIDFFVGIIPIFGDTADFIFKANSKNLAILRKYMKTGVVDAEFVD